MSILPEQHSSASNPLYITKKSAAKTKEKEPVRPHVKASLEDINWVRSQAPCVQQLWLDCVAVEQFGCQLRKLETHLSSKSFRIAKTALEKRELFRFEAITQVSPSGRSNITGWKIENLHGYYYKAYWETVPPEREVLPASRENLPASGENLPTSGEVLPSEREILPDVVPETRSTTYSAKTEPTLNQMLTTPLPPPKGVEEGSCISQETQQTPLGGAAATSGEMQEKEEDAPDTSTTSVKDKQEVNGIPINLSEDQSFGGGGITTELSSDVAYTEFPFQVGSQVTINWPNTEYDGKTGIVEKLYWKHQEVDVQLKGVLAIFCFPMARILGSGIAPSTKAPRFNPEHAQNRKARQSRLKCADMLGECPGAEFLTECWQDILLRSQVRVLIAKHPQWGIFVDSADQLQCWFD